MVLLADVDTDPRWPGLPAGARGQRLPQYPGRPAGNRRGRRGGPELFRRGHPDCSPRRPSRKPPDSPTSPAGPCSLAVRIGTVQSRAETCRPPWNTARRSTWPAASSWRRTAAPRTRPWPSSPGLQQPEPEAAGCRRGRAPEPHQRRSPHPLRRVAAGGWGPRLGTAGPRMKGMTTTRPAPFSLRRSPFPPSARHCCSASAKARSCRSSPLSARDLGASVAGGRADRHADRHRLLVLQPAGLADHPSSANAGPSSARRRGARPRAGRCARCRRRPLAARARRSSWSAWPPAVFSLARQNYLTEAVPIISAPARCRRSAA